MSKHSQHARGEENFAARGLELGEERTMHARGVKAEGLARKSKES